MRRTFCCLMGIVASMALLGMYSGASAEQICGTMPALTADGPSVPICFQAPGEANSIALLDDEPTECQTSPEVWPFQASVNPNNLNVLLGMLQRFNTDKHLDVEVPFDVPNLEDPNEPAWHFVLHIFVPLKLEFPAAPITPVTALGSTTITKKVAEATVGLNFALSSPQGCEEDQICQLVLFVFNGCHDEGCEAMFDPPGQFSGMLDLIDADLGIGEGASIEQTADTCVVPRLGKPNKVGKRACQVIIPLTANVVDLKAKIQIFADSESIVPNPSLAWLLAYMNEYLLPAMVPDLLNKAVAEKLVRRDGSGDLFWPFQYQIAHDGAMPIEQLVECRRSKSE